MMKNNRVGESFVNKKELGGYKFIIVEYNNNINLYVQFQDKYKAKVHTTYQHCKNGNVKNPYHPSVYGIGCLGLMSDGSKPKISKDNKLNRKYKLWTSMIERCYSNNRPSYKDAEVCERWLIFANFLEDLPLIEGYSLWLEHPNEYMALDKDIKGNGSKVYSLDTCCFVSISDNVKEELDRCKLLVKIYGINIETGERTRDFDSVSEASRELNINTSSISNCLNGRYKTSGGYKWFKVEKESE